MSDMTVANTILQQLGGGRFIAMTGAKNLTGCENSLNFQIGRFAGLKITHVCIELNDDDLYTITFQRYQKRPVFRYEAVKQVEGVYAEDLQRIFTETTGLKTCL
jgi:hypothetical protein